MQNDEMIWHVLNHQFCSFQTTFGTAKSDKTKFCRHPYSVTGLCNRTSCPLANSKYATLREEEPGKIYLCIKTVERAHSPKNLWEKILLSRNYSKALQQIDKHLEYNFSQVLIHRNKQRLTKIHQYLIRMRKLELKEWAGRKPQMTRVHRKVDQREERRERKALVAAKLEHSIQKELVQRLAKGTYGDIYNFPETPYQKALQQHMEEEEEEESEEEESIVEYVEDLGEEEETEDVENLEYRGNNEWGMAEDDDDDDDDDQGESEDDDDDKNDNDTNDDKEDRKLPAKKRESKDSPAASSSLSYKRRRRAQPRIEIEYEEETEDQAQLATQETATTW